MNGKAKSKKAKVKSDNAVFKKQHLPTKLCATCGKPFTWRKKWAKVWDEVKYCSERCRGNRVNQNS